MAVLDGNISMRTLIMKTTTLLAIIACVRLMRAALIFCLDRWIDITTEEPMPSIRPIEMNRIHTGTMRFTAASASVPNPCPMKIPSIAVTAERLKEPISVGTNSFLNKSEVRSFSKSTASLLITSKAIIEIWD